jgi:K+ transporter
MACEEGATVAVDVSGGHAQTGTAALALSAIGVVYGDVGTSAIDALRETGRAAAGEAVPHRL